MEGTLGIYIEKYFMRQLVVELLRRMNTRSFGPTGIDVPVIGQGTWRMERSDRAATIRALHRGLDLGATHIDTAEMYGNGAAEELVGEAIRGRRDGVYLVSKVLPSNASRAGTIGACEGSLRRLATDRLDCYLLHWEGSHPLTETVAAFEQLLVDGKIRAWGVSNFDERAMAEAVAVAGAESIACNQVCYHLQERAIEHAVLPFCAQHGIAVVAYSPFGSGSFPAACSPGGQLLAEIGASREASAYQIALAFLCRRRAQFAIPKSATVAHVEDNAAAGALALTDAEIERIDAVFPLGRPRRGVPMI